MSSMNHTPVSLLERLREQPTAAAWDRFVSLYTPLLYHWASRFTKQDSDAADLVQEVFAVLLKELPRFHYEPGKRFRGWLWTVLTNKWRARLRHRQARPVEFGDSCLDEHFSVSAVPLEEGEYRQYLVQRALQVMQADFEPATWRACWEYVVVGRPAAEVAQELGLTTNAVHLARARVLRRLRQELTGLLD